MLSALLRKELLELRRTHKGLVLIVIFLGLGLLSPLAAKMMPSLIKAMIASVPGAAFTIPEPTANDAYAQFHKNMYQMGMLALVIISMGTVANEKTSRTLVMVLSKPVSRTSFILAKFCSYAVLASIALVISLAGCQLYTYLLFSSVNLAAGAFSALVIWADILFLLALVMVLSSVLPGASACALAAIGSHLVLSGLSFVYQTRAVIIPGHNSSLSYFLVTGGRTPLEALPAIAIDLVGAALLLAISIRLFQRQEF